MAADNFQDSNYGSLGGFQSSSSSFTMSLSESEADYLPSTSGCSSDLPYPKRMQLKEQRKEQVKKYLKQLKSMVPCPNGNKGRKMGTLSALQHVVDSFKKIKEDSDLPSAEKHTEDLENELQLTTFEGQDDLSPKILETSKNLFVTVALPNLTVTHVSSNLKDVLGYPQDAWLGRCLDDFVHRWDIVTMKSSIAINRDNEPCPESKDQDACPREKRAISRLRRKIFYFRLRHFKSLANGYSLQERDSSYRAFQTCVSIGHKPDPTVKCGMDANEEFQNRQEWLILRCTPLKSVYEVDNLPEEDCTFHTRHNLFCSYSHIDPKALSILGFLPQDVIGRSIFNFYHTDDMELLYTVYQQVVMTKKIPFKSMPFRFRTRNGGWVYVETEWSSFVNPWTHKLDFVIGKHTALKGQRAENIFDCIKLDTDNIGERAKKYQTMIRELLLQPLSGLSAQFGTEIPQNVISGNQDDRETYAMVTDENNTASIDIDSLDSIPADKARKLVPPAAIGNTQQRLCEEDVSVAYEQLNYTNNIKSSTGRRPEEHMPWRIVHRPSVNNSFVIATPPERFLLSQPNSFSPSTFKKIPSSTEEESSETCDSMLEVDISVPKPPSFGSSTKVLVSEQEQREDVVSSPAVIPDLFDEGPSVKESVVREVGVTSNTVPPAVAAVPEKDSLALKSLTQKTLFEHTRRQEQLFIREAKQDRNLIVLKRNYRMHNTEETSSCLKRSHSPDSMNKDRQHRAIKTLKSQDVSEIPQFGVRVQEDSKANVNNGAAGPPVFLPFNMSNCPAGISGIPFVQVDPATGVQIPSVLMSPKSSNIPTSLHQTPTSVQWPYYPQSGVSFIPQVMGGFFQSSTGIAINSQSVPLGALVTAVPIQTTAASVLSDNPVTPTLSSIPSHIANLSPSQHIQSLTPVRKPSDTLKNLSSSEMSSSFEETSSSLYYLLESGSPSLSSNGSQQGFGYKQKKNLQDPLWLMGVKWTSDVQMRYRLPKPKQKLVLKKDREILEKLNQPEQLITQFHVFDEEIMDMSFSVMDEEADFLLWPENVHSTPTQKESVQALTTNCEDHSHGLEDVDISWLFEDDDIGTERMDADDPEGKDLHINSSSSHEDDESSCKSSNLTPSDERSNEELGSSIKESDASSSDQGSRGDLKYSSESEVETGAPESDNSHFNLFFRELPVEFSSDEHKAPPWLKNAIFNDKVSMEYCIPTTDLQKQLLQDKKKLENMKQPYSVLTHMNELMEEISQTTLSEESTSLQNNESSFGNSYSCCGKKTVQNAGNTSLGEVDSENVRTDTEKTSSSVEMTSGQCLAEHSERSKISIDKQAFDTFFDSLFSVFVPIDVFSSAPVSSPESIHDSFMEEVD